MTKEKKLADNKIASPDCIFCKIANQGASNAGELKPLIYEDDETAAFFTMAPLNVGHTLVIPKRHAENIYSADDKMLEAIAKTIKKLAVAIKKTTGAAGINVFQNNEYVAGQRVFHLHFHVIPRHEGDGFKHWEHTRDYSKEEISTCEAKIKALLITT